LSKQRAYYSNVAASFTLPHRVQIKKDRYIFTYRPIFRNRVPVFMIFWQILQYSNMQVACCCTELYESYST